MTASGESVFVVLSQAEKTLAEKHWSTGFTTLSDFPVRFWPAGVHGEDLLAELLHSAVFTQDDLAQLSSSEIPEVRQAAVRNLTDQSLLAKIALEDEVQSVRESAIGKLTDQALLARIAVEDKQYEVRYTAKQRLAEIRKNTK